MANVWSIGHYRVPQIWPPLEPSRPYQWRSRQDGVCSLRSRLKEIGSGYAQSMQWTRMIISWDWGNMGKLSQTNLI